FSTRNVTDLDPNPLTPGPFLLWALRFCPFLSSSPLLPGSAPSSPSPARAQAERRDLQENSFRDRRAFWKTPPPQSFIRKEGFLIRNLDLRRSVVGISVFTGGKVATKPCSYHGFPET
ncbi:hypothetical protein EJB05_31577, partial [Eragrostis curvula]